MLREQARGRGKRRRKLAIDVDYPYQSVIKGILGKGQTRVGDIPILTNFSAPFTLSNSNKIQDQTHSSTLFKSFTILSANPVSLLTPFDCPTESRVVGLRSLWSVMGFRHGFCTPALLINTSTWDVKLKTQNADMERV